MKFLCTLVGLLLSATAVAARKPQAAVSSVKHYGYTAMDKFVECAQRASGKNVAYSPKVADLGPELADAPCAKDVTSLRALLNQKQITVFDAGDWAFLIPSIFFNATPDSPYYQVRIKWKSLKIVANIHPGKLSGEDEPGFSAQEAKAAGEAALRAARMIPLVQPTNPVTGDAATVTIDIEVIAAQLQPSRAAGVLCVINQGDGLGGNARMVYEEVQEGQYRVLWDSPIYKPAPIELMDVDGDGWKEMLIQDEQRDVHSAHSTLVIFDHEGHELSRQACDPGEVSGEVCPIGAESNMTFGENEVGPKQINVGNDVYLLADGLYVCDEKESEQKRARRAAAEQNRAGVRLLRAGKVIDATTQFLGAAYGDKSNAEYVNNLGYAECKQERYSEGIEHLREAIDLDSGRAVAYLNLAEALLKQNPNINKLEARQAYAKYLELAPESKAAPDVRKKLDELTVPAANADSFTFIDAVWADVSGWEKMTNGKYTEAVADFLAAANHFPYNPKFLTDVGLAYSKTGKPMEALDRINKARELAPDYPRIYPALGDLNAELKRYAQARAAYGRYLQLDPDTAMSAEVKKKLEDLPSL